MPPKLAAKLDRARAAQVTHGERRIVTMLFCDLEGSTAAAERVDPEQWVEIMNGVFERMIAPVYRYEGTVENLLGDGMLAFFGAPLAHEDDPERAILAGLEIVSGMDDFRQKVSERWNVTINVRVGINTGLVVVGAVGSNLHVEYTAVGDAINLAARMEQTAQPGTVQITEHTRRLVSSLFEVEDLGAIAVKGKGQPIRAYRVLAEKEAHRRMAIAADQELTPFVGREREREQLLACFRRAKKGHGQVVFLSGEAGIGKSRLLAEFRRLLGSEEIVWLEGQCVAYRQSTPYLPIIQMLKQAFGVEANDTELRVIQRVDRTTAQWDAATRETVPYLKFLLSADPGDPRVMKMDARTRRAGIYDGLRALFLQQSREQPLVLAMEDVHWLDEQSEAALVALVDMIATVPVLWVLTYRLGYTHALGERSYYTHLLLRDLQPEQSALLVQGVLHTSELPAELSQLIVEKGDGNPFYIEEVIRSLLEMGILRKQEGRVTLTRPLGRIRVPDTVQEVILSRIDRLALEARSALQLASVIGREFTALILKQISDLEAQLEEILEELKLLELIYQKSYFPDRAYVFKHALTQSVAYSTLLRERRKNLHRVIGGAIEELYADRLVEQYDVLAYHFLEGEEWAKAVAYLLKAGDKARLAFADKSALDYYSRALEVCGELGEKALETAAEILRLRGGVQTSPESAWTDFDNMYNVAQRLRDPYLEAAALAHRGRMELIKHELETAESTLQLALTIASDSFEDVRLLANSTLLNMYLIFNRQAEARRCVEALEGLAPLVDDPVVLSDLSRVRALAANWEGDFDAALKHSFNWQSQAASSFDYVNQHWTEALALGGKGEYERALTLLEDIVAIYKRIDPEAPPFPQILNTLGWIYGELQHLQQALLLNEQSIEAARALNLTNPEAENNARLNLGDNYLALGLLDRAEDQFRHVEELVRHPSPEERWMLWRYAQHLFHSYGELWLMRGHAGRALSYAAECLALAHQSNSRKNIVKGLRLRGQAFIAQGMLDEAAHELTAALEMAREVGNPPQLWKTHLTNGDLLLAREQPQAARESYGAAMVVIEQVASSLSDEALRTTFLQSQHVRLIQKKVASIDD